MGTDGGQVSVNPFERALAIEDRVPLFWTPIPELPRGHRLMLENAGNEALMFACDGLEEPHREYDDSDDVLDALRRMESKIDLLLKIVAEWLPRPDGIPPECDIRLNAYGLQWNDDQVPEVGSLIRVNLFLCPTLPKCLKLYGRVLRVEALGSAPLIVFEGMSPTCRDALQRLVFSRHRREIAHSRDDD